MTEDLLADDTNDPVVDPNKNYLEELVGEGKKFKTPEELARGKAESDAYISTLIRTQDEMRADLLKLREEYNASASMKELLDQLKNQQSHEQPPVDDGKDTNAFDLNKIDSLLDEKWEQKTRQQRERDNFNQVQTKMKELGISSNALRQKRDELGLTDEDVNALARRSPKAFFNTFEISERKSESFQNPPTNTRRTDPFAPKTGEVRDFDFYQKMRKEKPDLYRDPRTVVQMHQDAIAMGAKFYKE